MIPTPQPAPTTPPIHILKHTVEEDGLSCRIRCGDIIGDILITVRGVYIVQHIRDSDKVGNFRFTGPNAMKNAIRNCFEPKMKAILTAADRLNS
jgi:hypothetical protein